MVKKVSAKRSRPKRRKPEGAIFSGKKVRFGIKKLTDEGNPALPFNLLESNTRF
jgi:hypothetical protein